MQHKDKMNITHYVTFDLPVPYKSIMLYPVPLKEYMPFSTYAQCLQLDKNSIPDVKIISMSELEYIFRASEENIEEQPYILWLDRLLALCLKDDKSFEKIEKSIERYQYDERGKPYILIGKEKFDSLDFEEIKSIISEQNMVDLPDESMSKEVRDSLEQARAYKSRGNKSPSFEDLLVSVATESGWELEYVYSLSIRKFFKSMKRMDNALHYKILLAASFTGAIDDKSIIKHWLSNIDDDDKYGDVTMDLDKVQDTLSLESAKH